MTDALNGQRRSAGAGFKMVYAGVLVVLAPGILLWVLLAGLSALSPGTSPRNGSLVVLVAAASVLSVVAFMRMRKAATRQCFYSTGRDRFRAERSFSALRSER